MVILVLTHKHVKLEGDFKGSEDIRFYWDFCIKMPGIT
jgi:hypothetical protein